jgi:WD40 repeat protein
VKTETKLFLGLFPVKRRVEIPEEYQVQVGTKSVQVAEQYQEQVGTRDVVECETVSEGGHRGPVNAVAFSSDGRKVISASDDNSVMCWDIESGMRAFHVTPHAGNVSSVVAVGSSHFATASWDQRVSLLNGTGAVERMFRGPANTRFYALAASADGSLLAGGVGHKQIIVWSTRVGNEVARLKGHGRKVLAVAFMRDGTRLVSGSSDMSVRVWNIRLSNCEAVLYGHSDDVKAVAVSPDGGLIASGGADGHIFLWDAKTGQQVLRASVHEDFNTMRVNRKRICSLTFSHDSRFVLGGCSDSIIRCWDTSTGQEVGQLQRHYGEVRGLAMSPVGKYLASGGWDGRVVLWSNEKPEVNGTSKSQPHLPPNVPSPLSCPRCGKPLKRTDGRYGPFMGCTGYPVCRYTRNL